MSNFDKMKEKVKKVDEKPTNEELAIQVNNLNDILEELLDMIQKRRF